MTTKRSHHEAARNRELVEDSESDTEPMQVGQGHKARGFRDGAGLPKDRRLPDSEVLRKIRQELLDFCDRHISKRLFAELASGRHTAAPFEARAVDESRKKVLGIKASASFDGTRQSRDQESPVEFRLVSALLEVSGDPNAGVFKDYA